MATIIESFLGKYLLNKLVTFAEEKVAMIIGAKDDLKRLEKRLRRVEAYIKDAEKRQINENLVKIWVDELKDFVYDVDDMIDLWRYKNKKLCSEETSSSSSPPTCCSFSLFSCFRTISVRHELVEQVQSLNLKLDEILIDMSRLSLQHIQPNAQEVGRMCASVSSPVMGVDVVGKEIEDSAKKMVEVATLDTKQKFKIAAITGMGGIGKTTLAKKIYNNETIQNRYVIKMWLSITRSYSYPQLIKEAIRNAGGNPGKAERESELIPILAETISGKSIFLVLDDVWCPDVWVYLLQDPIKANATQGFILVTTRDQTIGMQVGAQHIHQATVLSTKTGWELLRRRTYLSDIQDIENLKEIGKKIVHKCGGLPVAIKAIAGMLAKKDKRKFEWQNVLTSSAWSINGLPKEIDQALYLSYEDLSPQLRQCFLYCSLYPPTKLISRRDVVRLWIAEGFVEARSDQMMEKVAEGYYEELVTRNLLEPDLSVSIDYTVCKMHDLLRSLAQYLSRGESFTGDKVLAYPADTSRLRRLSLAETNESVSLPGSPTEQLRLRTFIIFNCEYQIEKNIVQRLKHLRLLYINEKGFNCIPESLGYLIHLRMLDLDRTSISTLPESIGSLTNLLFLNLRGCDLLHTLPRSITRLCNLRSLRINGTPLTSVPQGLGGLQKLTEIRGFIVAGENDRNTDQNGWDLQELERLSQLRRISIYQLEKARDVSVVLANKIHLKELNLSFSKVDGIHSQVVQFQNENSREIMEKLYPPSCIEDLIIENYMGKMLPIWMSSSLAFHLPNLMYIQLIGWSCCANLPPFGLLPNLKYLKIEGASAIVRISLQFLGITGWKGANFPTVFPKLEYLIFNDLPNWEEWSFPDCDGENSSSLQLMPHLKNLGFFICPKLRGIPKGLQHLCAVEKLAVYNSDSIISIKDFPFGCEKLEVHNNNSLESLTNLPGIKKIKIDSNRNLRHVSKVDSLEALYLQDYEMERLPEWLLKLTEERKGQKEDELHLDLFCSRAVLERCLKDGPDWPIIKSFSSVNAYDKEKTAYMEYTRDPESYFSSL